MRSLKTISFMTAAFMASTMMASAADLVIDPPEEITPVGHGGWYLRGDIGYAKYEMEDDIMYRQGGGGLTGTFDENDFGSGWMGGVGIGYQVNDYFRVDATYNFYSQVDLEGSSAVGVLCQNGDGVNDICDYDDDSKMSVSTLMANAYLDLGTYHGFTPYLGVGIGGAKVHWDGIDNQEECVSGNCGGFATVRGEHDGIDSWRFAYALHAGASYDLDAQWKIDAGYSLTRVEGGDMFDFEDGNPAEGDPQGVDKGFDMHTFKLGLRYSWN